MRQQLRNTVEGHRLLFRFMFRDGLALLAEVAAAWDNPVKVQSPAGVVTRLSVEKSVIDGYNQRYENVKLQLRKLVRTRGHFGPYYLAPLFAVRILTVAAAAFFGFWATFATSLLQFVVAPYSFFAAFAAWLGILPFYVIHFVYFAGIQAGTWVVYSHFPIVAHFLRIPVTLTFIAIWFAVDQLSCFVLLFWTPAGPPVPVPPKQVLKSMAYGFLNAKTYWLILLLCLRGFRVDLLALGIYAFMPRIIGELAHGVFRRILPPYTLHHTFANTMFYHYHRMVHLPGPYNEGHRHHHYLPDATAFDAHMHGTGMPEEWFKLMTELGVSLSTGLMPWSFTHGAIKQSLFNRLGHTRVQGEDPVGENFHVNHHLKHFKNFGFVFFPLDMLFGTELGDVSGLGHLTKDRVRCTKEEEGERYVLVIEPATPVGAPNVNVGHSTGRLELPHPT